MTTLWIYLGSLAASFGIFRPGIAKKRYKNNMYFTGETKDRVFYTLFFGAVIGMAVWLVGETQQWWM